MEIHIVWGLTTTPEEDRPEGGEGQEGSSGAGPSSEMHSEIPPRLTGGNVEHRWGFRRRRLLHLHDVLMMEICLPVAI